MRIAFMGSPKDVIRPLETIIEICKERSWTDPLIISQPAKPAGRKKILKDPPVAEWAKSQNLYVTQPVKASSDQFLDELREFSPDLIITAAYGQILSEKFLAIPIRATINIHPSALPKFRGAIPVPATILAGHAKTTVSILFTVKRLDAGAIITTKDFEIKPEERADQLTERLFAESAKMLPDVLKKLEDTGFIGEEQNESQATHCKKIVKADGLINWELPAEQIYNQFRAYYPWPGCWTFNQKGKVAIEAIEHISEYQTGMKPGHYSFSKSLRGIVVGTKTNPLLVKQVKPAGSKVIAASDWWNGRKSKLDIEVFLNSTEKDNG
tara:strand:- start:1253 stop:2227 length:975 start_codon:yes stop_codon:yes gene_type:complete